MYGGSCSKPPFSRRPGSPEVTESAEEASDDEYNEECVHSDEY